MRRPHLRIAIIVIVLIVLSSFTNLTLHGAATKDAVCGDNFREGAEECDGIDDAACSGLCSKDCNCPPAYSRALAESSRQTYSYDIVRANEIKTANLNLPVAFQSINIAFGENMRNVNLFVDANISAPRILPPKTINYEFFNIYLFNSSQEDDAYLVQVLFKVPNSWLISNDIRELTVQRANRNEWSSVDLTKLHQDIEYTYFLAQPTGFGLFAIAGRSLEILTEKAVCGNGILEPGETWESCCADAGCPDGQSCIAGTCKQMAICGNNVCEPDETFESCPEDCARTLFAADAPPIIVLLTVLMVAAIIFLGRSAFKKTKIEKRPRASLIQRS